MDAVVDLLDGPRARDAFVLRCVLEPPWSLRIRDEAPLAVVAVVRGTAWIAPDEGDAVRLAAGDVAIVRGPAPYSVADDPATPAQVVIHPGDRCTDLEGRSVADEMGLGSRTWGNDPHGSTVLLTGTYHTDSEVSRRLLGALPRVALVPAGDVDGALVSLLAAELGREAPGQQAVLDRLLDLVLVAVLRAWFERPDAAPPAWYRADADPTVGAALRLLHHEPARPWTVASLAAAVHTSRASLARRFCELVGEPPMTYLTKWRMAMAADLLRDTTASVGGVARQVGYTSPFTFSTAFKRTYGRSPSAHRRPA